MESLPEKLVSGVGGWKINPRHTKGEPTIYQGACRGLALTQDTLSLIGGLHMSAVTSTVQQSRPSGDVLYCARDHWLIPQRLLSQCEITDRSETSKEKLKEGPGFASPFIRRLSLEVWAALKY